ncbi:MAG: hypothetical protein KC912_23480 [Proteobacteria bacterium]|nr:hypothetical protein [Pseudomonadota bacterium]
MLLPLLALLAPATAATLTTCGDVPVSSCHATLQGAIDAANPDDTIAIAAGTYRESILVSGTTLTLEGSDEVYLLGSGEPAVPVIDVANATMTLSTVAIASELQRPMRIDQSTVSVQISTLRGGAFQTLGGVIYATDSDLSLSQSGVRHGVGIHGGLVALERSTLFATRTSFTDGSADMDGGAIYAADAQSSILLTNISTVIGNSARSGGGVMVDGALSLDVRSVTLHDNTASSGGGAIASISTPVSVNQSTLTNNSAGTGGAITNASAPFSLTQSFLCHNQGRTGSAVHVAASDSVITNTTFFRNAATEDSALVMTGSPDSTLVAYNDFIANDAANYAAVSLPSGVAVFSSNVVSHNTSRTDGSEPPVTWPRASKDLRAGHNLYFDNAGRDVAEALQENQVIETPLLRSIDANSSCSSVLPLVFAGSATIDAGPPTATDPDGSIADIGALGGPDALAGYWGDSDGDTWPAAYDCEDGNASVSPDAVDVPYDGVDTNCDGWDDFDADGDQHTAKAWGGDDCDDDDPETHPGAPDSGLDLLDQDCDGEPEADHDGDGYDGLIHGGDDCDDEDARIHPGAVDASDFVDMDCDGIRSVQDPVKPTGCTHSDGPLLALWLMPLVALRRRRA